MIDLRAINRDQFKSAKSFWGTALAIKLAAFGVGVYAVFSESTPNYLPQVLLALAIISELCQLRSDETKSQAESLLRTLDICQSFGRKISEADKRDIVLAAPRSRRKSIEQAAVDEYFHSDDVPGPRRAILNLIESAWYTRHLAWKMMLIYLGLISLLLVVSVSALMAAARSIADATLRDQVTRAVTAWLLLIVSISMLKNAWAYFKMYQRCQRTELACGHLAMGETSEADAVKQWYEYQLARSGSPLLPEWLWRVSRSSLDEAWRLAQQ